MLITKYSTSILPRKTVEMWLRMCKMMAIRRGGDKNCRERASISSVSVDQTS